MYFNKIYSSSTERIITRSSPNDTFDIELQHPQPRRRQTFDRTNDNDDNKDQYFTRDYSLPPKQEDFYSSDLDRLPSINSIVTMPTTISTILSPDSIIVPSLPEIVEEK